MLAQIPSLQRAELSTYLAHLGPTAGVCVVMPGGGGAGAPGTPRVVSGGMDDRMVCAQTSRAARAFSVTAKQLNQMIWLS